MRSGIFSLINDILVVCLLAFLLLAGVLFFSRFFETKEVIVDQAKSPSFIPIISKKDYSQIGIASLALKEDFLAVKLPDLREIFSYYGENSRPDSALGGQTYSIAANKKFASVLAGQPVFISSSGGKYHFSQDNQETNVWVELDPRPQDVLFNVFLKDETGEIITTPQVLSKFVAKKSSLTKEELGTWRLGRISVDKDILKNQKARWYGRDIFFEKHGGQEYEFAQEMERLDFGDGRSSYFTFVKEGEKLIWKDEQWQRPAEGEATIHYPLMLFKTITEKQLAAKLWDITGRRVFDLILPKARPPLLLTTDVTKSFAFIGYKTRSEFVVEVDKKRITVEPDDWLMKDPKKGWQKLVSKEDLDDYVNRKKIGILLVVDGVEKRESKLILKAHLFDSSRTRVKDIEIPQRTGSPGGTSRGNIGRSTADKRPERAKPQLRKPAGVKPRRMPVRRLRMPMPQG